MSPGVTLSKEWAKKTFFKFIFLFFKIFFIIGYNIFSHVPGGIVDSISINVFEDIFFIITEKLLVNSFKFIELLDYKSQFIETIIISAFE